MPKAKTPTAATAWSSPLQEATVCVQAACGGTPCVLPNEKKLKQHMDTLINEFPVTPPHLFRCCGCDAEVPHAIFRRYEERVDHEGKVIEYTKGRECATYCTECYNWRYDVPREVNGEENPAYVAFNLGVTAEIVVMQNLYKLEAKKKSGSNVKKFVYIYNDDEGVRRCQQFNTFTSAKAAFNIPDAFERIGFAGMQALDNAGRARGSS